MESWFKLASRLVVEDPAHWSKSPLGVLSQLTHEALLVFLFLKVAGNFQTTFRVSRVVLSRVGGFTGNGLYLEDILYELETANLIKVDGENFTLTDSTAATKAKTPEEPEVPAYTPALSLTREEKRAKAFAGQCDSEELFNLMFDNVITDAEYKQLEKEHKYIGEKF
ncbi:MAG: hypothetical protein L7F78_11905 [Syntrophales bacterium LBB04]|nr:hypothetical protein [Syntrophales bacterium LBB04]